MSPVQLQALLLIQITSFKTIEQRKRRSPIMGRTTASVSADTFINLSIINQHHCHTLFSNSFYFTLFLIPPEHQQQQWNGKRRSVNSSTKSAQSTFLDVVVHTHLIRSSSHTPTQEALHRKQYNFINHRAINFPHPTMWPVSTQGVQSHFNFQHTRHICTIRKYTKCNLFGYLNQACTLQKIGTGQDSRIRQAAEDMLIVPYFLSAAPLRTLPWK